MHCPPGFAPRPRNTGWYASFGTLSQAPSGVDYTSDGRRFMGATFDASSLYRQRAALRFLAAEGLDAAAIHAHARGLQHRFLDGVRPLGLPIFAEARLVVPVDGPHGNFLTFDYPDAAAWYVHSALKMMARVARVQEQLIQSWNVLATINYPGRLLQDARQPWQQLGLPIPSVPVDGIYHGQQKPAHGRRAVRTPGVRVDA